MTPMLTHLAAFIGGPILTCLIIFAFAKLVEHFDRSES